MVLIRKYLSIAIVGSGLLLIIFLRGAFVWVDFEDNTIKIGRGANEISNKSISESKKNGQYIVTYKPYGANKDEMKIYNLFIGDIWAEYEPYPMYASYRKGPINYFDLNEISVKYSLKKSKAKNLIFTHFKTIDDITQYYIHRKKHLHKDIEDTIQINEKFIFIFWKRHNTDEYSYIDATKTKGLLTYKHFFRISVNDSLLKKINSDEERIGDFIQYHKYMGNDITKYVPQDFFIELNIVEIDTNKKSYNDTIKKTYKYKMKCVYPIEYKQLTYNPFAFFVYEKKYWGRSR